MTTEMSDGGFHPTSIPIAFCIVALKYRVEQLSTKALEG